MLAKTSWYKRKRKSEEEEEGDKPKKRKIWKEQDEKIEKREAPNQGKSKAVIFVPYTQHSELAKELRQSEPKLEELSGYKLKVVERAGSRLEDLLCKSVHGMVKIAAENSACSAELKKKQEN